MPEPERSPLRKVLDQSDLSERIKKKRKSDADARRKKERRKSAQQERYAPAK